MADRRYRWIRRDQRVRGHTEVAETAASVEVLWIPSISSLDDGDAFFWADPAAYSTARATVEVQQVSSAVTCLDGVSLLWELSRVGLVEEVSESRGVGYPAVGRGLDLSNY